MALCLSCMVVCVRQAGCARAMWCSVLWMGRHRCAVVCRCWLARARSRCCVDRRQMSAQRWSGGRRRRISRASACTMTSCAASQTCTCLHERRPRSDASLQETFMPSHPKNQWRKLGQATCRPVRHGTASGFPRPLAVCSAVGATRPSARRP